MLIIGDFLAETIKARILRAQDVYDNPAPPLKQPERNLTSSRNIRTVRGQQLYQLPGKLYRGYPYYKAKRGIEPVRNWKFTGRTLRALRALSTSQNSVKIGFSDPVADLRVTINNRRWRQFGLSPRDRAAAIRIIKTIKYVSVKAA